MIEIVKFFSQYSIWVYLGLTIIFITGLRKLLIILSDRRTLVFGLEKELIQRRINRIITLLSLIALIILAEFILVTFLVPTLPSATQLITQTIDPLLGPPISQQKNVLGTENSTVALPNIISENCIPDQLIITEPVSGQEIRGEVGIIGTVDISNFGFYKYEYAPTGSEIWTTILAGRNPVIDGELGKWDVTELTPGDYHLRLVVFDNINTEYPACSITIKISN